MDVREKPGISYSWRSIVRGVQALKKGLIWRVGDGTQIDIWSDPWLPDGITRRPVTPRGHTLLRRVSKLIDPVSGDWDRALIQSVFLEEDVARILCIPVKQGMEDLLAWHYDKKGVFSVKSAYHVLDDGKTRDKIRQQGESSSSSLSSRSPCFKWKSVWQLKCPPKFAIFSGGFHIIVCL